MTEDEIEIAADEIYEGLMKVYQPHYHQAEMGHLEIVVSGTCMALAKFLEKANTPYADGGMPREIEIVAAGIHHLVEGQSGYVPHLAARILDTARAKISEEDIAESMKFWPRAGEAPVASE